MSTYTFICLVDGQRVGGSDENTLQEINDLMECIMCNHENGCPSQNFMETLYLFDQAVLVTPDETGVGISIAYLNK